MTQTLTFLGISIAGSFASDAAESIPWAATGLAVMALVSLIFAIINICKRGLG
jgi:hypothetical protein